MEIAGGVVLRRAAIGPRIGDRLIDVGADQYFRPSSIVVAGPWKKGKKVSARTREISVGGGFSDEGHLKYYASLARCRDEKKKEKKRARLVKGLTKDLSELCAIGIGVDAEEGIAGEARGKMISEAAELLLAELNQLRGQEKEMKKNRKAKACAKDEESSSSSSESSSDSECDEQVVDVSSLRTSAAPAPPPPPPPPTTTLEEVQFENQLAPATATLAAAHREEECRTTCSGATAAAAAAANEGKIEVCLGGKCKRSGAVELMAEFERKIGVEGAVVGCKCVGKCRQGPNVRVVVPPCEGEGDLSVNPLCIGVGLEDVGTIVANYFGEKKRI